MPPLPHAVSLCAVWQTPDLVQSVQVVSLQTLPMQVAGVAHEAQDAPAVPHAELALPPWQAPLESQQPAQL